MRRHIPEGRRPQLHHIKSLKAVIIYVGVVQNKPYYCACVHVLCTLHTQLE